MKERKRVLTILGGIINVLIGIFTIFVSGYFLIMAIQETDPWLILATFGMLIIFAFVFFIVGLGLAIALISIGGIEIRLGARKNLEYSARKGMVAGFCIFEGIVIVLFSILSALAVSIEPLAVSGMLIAVGIGISFIFKIIDLIVFNSYVKKGKIILNPKTSLDAKANINLENLNKLDLKVDKKNKKEEKKEEIDLDALKKITAPKKNSVKKSKK